jgi:L-iditol 2-dehydrogenase
MKIARITGTKQAEISEVAAPKACPELVVVKIHVAPMCCEYKQYLDGGDGALGHEAAGEVVEIAQPCRVKIGDRVVVQPRYACGVCPLCLAGENIHCENQLDVSALTGSDYGTPTYAQYIVKPDWLLTPIPEGMSYEHAAMACCGLGPTFGSQRLMNVDGFDTILIAGMGPVGLGGVINAKYRGARVLALETHPCRRELAGKLGADEVLDGTRDDVAKRILDLTEGRGVDKALDCTGISPVQRLLIDATRRKGEVAFVGEGKELSVSISKDMIRNGLTFRGVWHYPLQETPRILQIIRECPGAMDTLITHRFPLADVEKAFELQLTKECGKVLLLPWA